MSDATSAPSSDCILTTMLTESPGFPDPLAILITAAGVCAAARRASASNIAAVSRVERSFLIIAAAS